MAVRKEGKMAGWMEGRKGKEGIGRKGRGREGRVQSTP